jgi:hypothetical protein
VAYVLERHVGKPRGFFTARGVAVGQLNRRFPSVVLTALGEGFVEQRKRDVRVDDLACRAWFDRAVIRTEEVVRAYRFKSFFFFFFCLVETGGDLVRQEQEVELRRPL